MSLCKHKVLEKDISGAHRCVDCDQVFNITDEKVDISSEETVTKEVGVSEQKTSTLGKYLIGPAIVGSAWLGTEAYRKGDEFLNSIRNQKPEVIIKEVIKPVEKKVYLDRPVVKWKTKTVYVDKPTPKPPEPKVNTGCSKEDVIEAMLTIKKSDLDKMFNDYRLDDEEWDEMEEDLDSY
jgi:hypothetical protein